MRVQRSQLSLDIRIPYYIYHFRDDVFFHDKPPVNGRQFTAEDMAANYRRLKSLGEFADKGPSALTFTTGAIPFESVTATDKLTMEIKLSEPFPTTHFTMFQDCLVRAYPPETFDMLDDPGNVIGTGPFIIDEYVSGVSMTLDKNPDYWKDDEKFPGNRQPYVDRLVLLMTADEATRVAALRSRQGDITQIGVAQINGIDTLKDLKERNPELALWPLVARSTQVFAMKQDLAPWDDVRVRHALQMAIDLEEVNDSYFSGFGEWQPWGLAGPAWAPLGVSNPFDTWPRELQKLWSYDREGAERLLDEAGYARGADGVRFRTEILLRPSHDVGYRELIADYWKEIGVEAEIKTVDAAAYNARISEGYEGLWPQTAGADHSSLFDVFQSLRQNSAFPGGIVDPKYHAMFDELNAATGDEQRRIAKALDMYAIEQHSYIWGPRVPSFVVSQPWVVGYNGEQGVGNCGWTQAWSRLWIDSQTKAEYN